MLQNNCPNNFSLHGFKSGLQFMEQHLPIILQSGNASNQAWAFADFIDSTLLTQLSSIKLVEC